MEKLVKREKTSDKNIYKNVASGTYYYRKGDTEVSLKETDFKKALMKKKVLEDKLDFLGNKSFTLRLRDTFVEHTEELHKMVHKGKRSAAYVKEFERLFNKHLLPEFGHLPLAKMDAPRFNKAVASESFGQIDLFNIKKFLNVHLKWCAYQGYINSLPLFKIPETDRRQRRIIKPHELRAIFSETEGPFHLFLSMALFLGMRRQEITNLAWDRVNLDQLYIVLRKQDEKNRKGRAFPFNQYLKQLFLKQFMVSGKTKWVFPNREDKSRHMSASGFKNTWKRVLEKAGMKDEDITWHDFRATYEFYAHKRTDFTDTQKEKFVGASIEMQRSRYVTFDAEDLRGLENVVQVPGLTELLETRGKHGKNE